MVTTSSDLLYPVRILLAHVCTPLGHEVLLWHAGLVCHHEDLRHRKDTVPVAPRYRQGAR
ncbi:hypothetical protein BD309DRAFT_963014 [Dichomitus squalens]|nr:hypothetical protein BD309DRAFT_963014 [Dichomitus squalens]